MYKKIMIMKCLDLYKYKSLLTSYILIREFVFHTQHIELNLNRFGICWRKT